MVKISSSFIFTTQAELNVAPEGPCGPVKILPSRHFVTGKNEFRKKCTNFLKTPACSPVPP